MRYYSEYSDRGRLGFPFLPLIGLASSVYAAKKAKSDAKVAGAYSDSVRVTADAPRPGWVVPALVAAGVVLVGGVVLATRRRR